MSEAQADPKEMRHAGRGDVRRGGIRRNERERESREFRDVFRNENDKGRLAAYRIHVELLFLRPLRHETRQKRAWLVVHDRAVRWCDEVLSLPTDFDGGVSGIA